mmetsp:Transcript_8868/g.23287  ORF Transcript_8868/g.23287 Transcript_8868/m.23287 type:complete len:318 (+) Transcript_8868:1159-2112(+)
MMQHHRRQILISALCLNGLLRKLEHILFSFYALCNAIGITLAKLSNGALPAARRLGRANSGTQLHHRLVEIASRLQIHEFPGKPRQSLHRSSRADLTTGRPQPCHHPNHVPIHRGDAAPKRDACNGAGRVLPHPVDVPKPVHIARQHPGVFFHDGLGAGMKQRRASVVAQARPQSVDLLELRVGEIRDRRKLLHPRVEVRNDGSHLCLLEHHFRNPNAVRRGSRVVLGRERERRGSERRGAPGECAMISRVPIEERSPEFFPFFFREGRQKDGFRRLRVLFGVDGLGIILRLVRLLRGGREGVNSATRWSGTTRGRS